MRIVIIEDEVLAAEKLKRYLKKWNASVEIVAHHTSISESVSWFKENTSNYDIAFFDIQLVDGLSFEIFKQVNIEKPVIFTTAFDEYALDAFKVNSIDYILKPVTFTEISNAMSKLSDMKSILSDKTKALKVEGDYKQLRQKDRFLVKMGNHIHSIQSQDISLFYAEGRTVYLITNSGKKFIIDYKLEDLIGVLNQQQFFRANRTFVLNLDTIKDVLVYSNSRLKVIPLVSVEKEIIVSREKVSQFKKWFEGSI